MNSAPSIIVFNSYGGSLLLATRDAGLTVTASFEDTGYGVESQKLNFSTVTYHDTLTDWPVDLDLRDTIVLGHPPCSGFSSQNRGRSSSTRGPTSKPFSCTRKILDYVLPREPRVVAIESVIGALDGARVVHDTYCQTYGYTPYRILVNSASFGVPQWRKRFWLILVKNEYARQDGMNLKLRNNIRHVRDVLDQTPRDPEVLKSQATRWSRQAKLFDQVDLGGLGLVSLLSSYYGNLINVLSHHLKFKQAWWRDAKTKDFIAKYVVGYNFTSHSLHVLNPNGFAPILLAGSWWWYRGEQLGLRDYKLLMGFPADYKFHQTRLTLELLSRGITPPVGSWILREICANFFDIRLIDRVTDERWPLSEQTCLPGETVSFLIHKTEEEERQACLPL